MTPQAMAIACVELRVSEIESDERWHKWERKWPGIGLIELTAGRNLMIRCSDEGFEYVYCPPFGEAAWLTRDEALRLVAESVEVTA